MKIFLRSFFISISVIIPIYGGLILFFGKLPSETDIAYWLGGFLAVMLIDVIDDMLEIRKCNQKIDKFNSDWEKLQSEWEESLPKKWEETPHKKT